MPEAGATVPPSRRLGVHAGDLDLDVGGVGAESHGDSGRGGRSGVDLDSSRGGARLFGGVVRPGRRTRPGSPIGAVAVGWWWYPVVLLGPLVFAIAVTGIAVLIGEPWIAARPPAMTLSIPVLGLTLVIPVLTDGLGEELGWRGYLRSRLLIRHRAIPASLILGLYWWLWQVKISDFAIWSGRVSVVSD